MEQFCEDWMDSLTQQIGEHEHFLIPGGTPLAAQLQMARTVCRRAERRLWTLHREDPLPLELLRFVNRLSDLFFILARFELDRQGWPEEKWKAFSYKNRK
jgi:ATP:cob(I)alamin adenosyltransferase